MRGAAPVSAGASGELERLIAAIGQDPRAQRAPRLGRRPRPRARRAARARRRRRRGRVRRISTSSATGSSTASTSPSRYALELPDALLRAIRVAVDGHGRRRRRTSTTGSPTSARKVPEEHRAEFDELLGEARLMYRLRDERGVFSDIWASGLMRRAALAAGRRLAGQGAHPRRRALRRRRLRRDVRAACPAPDGPSADELAARAEYRAAHSAKDAPPSLGPPPPPPPDPSGLPPGVGAGDARDRHRAGRSCSAAPRRRTRRTCCAGWRRAGASTKGRRAASPGPSEFDRIVQGDVLVTESTTEAFNILLPLLGAIVTDSGGLLSHSAIVAREYGIPGVVGTRDATERIADGDARARRRRRRRSDGARVKEVVPLDEGARRPRSSARRRSGSGRRCGTGCPVPPGVALSGAIVEAVAAGERARDRAGREGGPAARRPARRALVGRGRGRRRRELRRPAPDAAQRPVGRTT